MKMTNQYTKLYLDDIRTPKTDGWIILRTYNEFVNWITKNGLPDEISFDHDLDYEHIKYYFNNGGHENPPNPQEVEFREKTGYDAAKWLCDYCWSNGLPIPKWNVHSANPVGSKNIEFILQNFEKKLNY
jgi:hypothetical protein